MDLNTHRKLLKRKHNSSIGEAEDRISELPDALLHNILSFLDIKLVVRTSVLSTRWNDIWASMPILKFPSWTSEVCLSEIDKFMDFVDRTLLLRDTSSNIQKVHLKTHPHMNNTSRVHSWISNITKRNNVKELNLYLNLDKPFSIPSSLFKSESLTKLDLSASCAIHIPKSFSFPKLKSLELRCIQFTEDDGWNEEHFSNCPVLESLILDNCTWFGSSIFYILTPALKVLKIRDYPPKEDGLQNYDLKIHAPDLESLIYSNVVAKDYDLSSFVKLDKAEIYFDKYDGDERIGQGAAVRKFLQALSHVRTLLTGGFELEDILYAEDSVNILPRFSNLNILDLTVGPVSDEVIFALLKAAPNLKNLRFDLDIFDDDDDDEHDNDDVVYDETDDLFAHLQSVWFGGFQVEGREMRWAKLILKTAMSLRKMTIPTGSCDVKEKELIESELQNVPRASVGCALKFV